MNKSIVLSLCLGLALAGWPARAAEADEKDPVVDGKPLSAWVQALKEKDAKAQQAAAAALVKLGKKASPATPALLDVLKNEESAYGRMLAAYALGHIRPEPTTAAPALAAALKDKDAEVRRSAASALVALGAGSKPVVPDVVRLLKDKDPQRRQLAAYILGNVPADADDVVPDLKAARNDKVASVRQAVETALKKYGDVAVKTPALPRTPGGPEEAVEAVIRAIVDVQPEVLWDRLPSSYQKDVNALSADFGNKMDSGVWQRTFAVARKGVTVLRDKKSFVLAKLQGGEADEAKLRMQYDALVNALQTVLSSELTDLDTFRRGDVKRLLSGPLKELLRNMVAISKDAAAAQSVEGGADLTALPNLLRRARVNATKAQGNQTTVEIDMGGSNRTELVMVKVEGKWVTKEMADNWSRNVKETRDGLAEMSSNMLRERAGTLKTLETIEKKLDKLSAAKSQFEFDLALLEVMQAFMQGQQLKK